MSYTQVRKYFRSPNEVRKHIRDGNKVSAYVRVGHNVRAHRRYLSELPDLNALLTTGVPLKHDVTVQFTPADRKMIYGSVGILAGAAVLAVLLAKR
jgi:hypothetical protein